MENDLFATIVIKIKPGKNRQYQILTPGEISDKKAGYLHGLEMFPGEDRVRQQNTAFQQLSTRGPLQKYQLEYLSM